MYTEKVTTQDQAICHLFFHCCLKDGRFSSSEIDAVSGQIVTAAAQSSGNGKSILIEWLTQVNRLNRLSYNPV